MASNKLVSCGPRKELAKVQVVSTKYSHDICSDLLAKLNKQTLAYARGARMSLTSSIDGPCIYAVRNLEFMVGVEQSK